MAKLFNIALAGQYPPMTNRLNHFDKLFAQKVGDSGVITTATGNPVSIITNKAQNAISTLLSYSPKQTGQGDPSPQNIRPLEWWTEANLTGAGKNLLDCTQPLVANPTGSGNDGLAFIPPALGIYTIKPSKFDGGYKYPYLRGRIVHADGTYEDYLAFSSAATQTDYTYKSFNISQKGDWIFLWAASALSPANIIALSEPQVELGSQSTDYAPFITPTTTTANLGGTYYGFSIDLERGVLRVTHQKLVFDGTEDDWGTALSGRLISRANVFSKNLIPNAKCNMYLKGTNGATTSHIYNDNPDFSFCTRTTEGYQTNLYIKDSRFENDLDGFKAWIAEYNLEFVEELATPLELPLTPQTVALLAGANTLWTDGDEVSVTYKAKKQGG